MNILYGNGLECCKTCTCNGTIICLSCEWLSLNNMPINYDPNYTISIDSGTKLVGKNNDSNL